MCAAQFKFQRQSIKGEQCCKDIGGIAGYASGSMLLVSSLAITLQCGTTLLRGMVLCKFGETYTRQAHALHLLLGAQV